MAYQSAVERARIKREEARKAALLAASLDAYPEGRGGSTVPALMQVASERREIARGLLMKARSEVSGEARALLVSRAEKELALCSELLAKVGV